MSVSGFSSFHHPSAHRPTVTYRFRRWSRLLVLLVAGLIALIAALLLEIRILPAVSLDGRAAAPTSNEIKRALICAGALLSPGSDPGCRVEPLLVR